MKPLGITPFFEVRKPSPTEDAIWEAVQSAIDCGWTPERFKQEASAAWIDKLCDDARHAQNVLNK